MSKRLVTENWYRFLSEGEGSSLDIYHTKEEIAQLEAMVEGLTEKIQVYRARIEYLQDQIAFDEYSSDQIKEDKDG